MPMSMVRLSGRAICPEATQALVFRGANNLHRRCLTAANAGDDKDAAVMLAAAGADAESRFWACKALEAAEDLMLLAGRSQISTEIIQPPSVPGEDRLVVRCALAERSFLNVGQICGLFHNGQTLIPYQTNIVPTSSGRQQQRDWVKSRDEYRNKPAPTAGLNHGLFGKKLTDERTAALRAM
jgi:hypothetical protein